MRGSGYQFVHAADMMYCADNHLRMMKTGESGLTTFRLLSKSNGWVWVQSNAKLAYKGGRPDFIIARQRALLNAEGEEHLCQRRLQLPFNFATGEALLYEVGPTLDITQLQTNQDFSSRSGGGGDSGDQQKEVGGLLGCFLNQDKNIYIQEQESQLPVDHVFMESRAMVNVPSDPWHALGLRADTSGNVAIKEEGDPLVAAMIDALENLAQDGELCMALEGLDVHPSEMMEWENTLQRLSQEEDDDNNCTKYELESLLNNDIFAYMDKILFKEITDTNLNGQSSCFSAVNTQGVPFGQTTQYTGSRSICEMMMLIQEPISDANAHSPAKGLSPAVPQPAHNATASETQGQNLARQTPAMFSSTQKLSHFDPPMGAGIPSVPANTKLLTDFFNPSGNLPALGLPTPPLGSNEQRPFEPCGQAMSNQAMSNQALPNQMLSNQMLSNQMISNQMISNQALSNQTPNQALSSQSLQPRPLMVMPTAPMLPNRHVHHGSIHQPAIHVATSMAASVPSIIPQNDFSLPANPIENSTLNLFAGDCLVQGGAPFQTHSNHRVPQWQQQNLLQQQQQQQTLPHAGITQNAHTLPVGSHSQPSESQRLAGLWAQNYNGGNPPPPKQTAPSSCMLDKPSRSPAVHPLGHPHHALTNCNPATANGTGLAPAMLPCQRANESPLQQQQSPPKGYVPCGQGPAGMPLVGTVPLGQENAGSTPSGRQLLQPNVSLATPEDCHHMQHYLDCNKHAPLGNTPRAVSNDCMRVSRAAAARSRSQIPCRDDVVHAGGMRVAGARPDFKRSN
ncbi:hypothetical protein CRUP_036334 [Coryphaenoides rupestris]|nr:hypothetical protein CRUP_036334 [Coryphaenoides rupestris]